MGINRYNRVMLNYLRKKKIAKRILWLLAILIIPAFIIWGAGNLVKKTATVKYIGSIDGRNINFHDFIKRMDDVTVEFFLNYFTQPEMLKKIREDKALVAKLTWNNLVIENYLRKRRIRISDDEVINFITTHPLFIRNGSFDKELYRYILQNTLAMTPRTFEESLRRYLARSRFRNELVKDVTVTDEEILDFYKKEHEKAKLLYILIDKDGFLDEVNVTEEEINEFYNENKEHFKTEEKIIIQYIKFDTSGGSDIKKLKDIYNTLRSNPKLIKKLAEKFGLIIKETEPFSKNEIVSEVGTIENLNNTVFRMRSYKDVAILRDKIKPEINYIVIVKKKIPPRVKAKEEIRELIISGIKNEKAFELAKDASWKIYSKNKGMKLEKIAHQNGVELLHTNLISRYDYIKGVGESYNIIEEAFKLGMGKISRPIPVRKGYILIEVEELKNIDKTTFAEKKEEYRKKLLYMKKLKAVQDWFKKISKNTKLYVALEDVI